MYRWKGFLFSARIYNVNRFRMSPNYPFCVKSWYRGDFSPKSVFFKMPYTRIHNVFTYLSTIPIFCKNAVSDGFLFKT